MSDGIARGQEYADGDFLTYSDLVVGEIYDVTMWADDPGVWVGGEPLTFRGRIINLGHTEEEWYLVFDVLNGELVGVLFLDLIEGTKVRVRHWQD